MKKKFISILKELRRLQFSYITLYLISLALLYKYTYFRAFHVNITSYLSISDIYVLLIDLIPGLIYFLIFITFTILFIFIISSILSRIGRIFRKNDKNPEINVKNDSKKPGIMEIFVAHLFPFVIFYTYTNIYVFPFGLNPHDSIYSGLDLFTRLILILVIVSSYIIQIFLVDSYKETYLKELKIKASKINLILLALTIFYITGITATLDAGKNIYLGDLHSIEFDYQGNKISSLDENLVYVGSTSNYLFIFYKDLAITKSFEINELKNLSYYNGIIFRHLKYKIKNKEINAENSKK